MTPFQSNEKHLSQLPALQLLINMGYEFIDHGEALRERQGRFSNVVLETILHDQLKKINHIHTKGKEYLFSEENIQTAIQKIKHIKYDGLIRTNEAIYDFLTLGTSLEQNIEGDLKSFTLNYVDWDHPENNRFHVTVEYVVERNRSEKTIRPDLVLFVNGFPLVVIECKAPHVDLEEAVSQSIWNQREDYSPGLFIYSQLIMAVNKNEAKYATTGTADRFWAVWKEVDNKQEDTDNETLLDLKNKSLSESVQKSIEQALNCQLPVLSTSTKLSINSVEGSIACPEQGRRVNYQLISEQDKALYALCRPERLLELSSKFIVFDAGIKKIARYQQYFVVKSTLERIQQKDEKGARKGGIIWHTQGSGKSLTMVMLARTLALTPDISNPRIVLVSDRDDLDKQLGNTFDACGLDLTRATSGRNLLSLVSENKSAIITTLIHKFEKAFSLTKYRDNSADIFILIDESHRSQFGTFSARMWQMFPRACYLGFTGTPLLKKDKNNFHKFGNLIEPHYPIAKAVEDGAVVPLLYEGRHIEMIQNKKAIDLWFERHTQGLTKEQQADLKRKYARAEMLNKTDYVIYMRAFDISEHFRATWQGTGFKGQLVAPGKAAALKYQEYFKEIGLINTEVLISGPDMREGYKEIDEDSKNPVNQFWDKMMLRFGNEETYNKQLINQFKHGNDPEIIIVVDKLLTGFDAPRNTVLYICKPLKEHSLLQAIARVNRLYEGKDFAYIVDYVSILGNLDEALTMYSALEDFDNSDLYDTLRSINSEIEKLPERYSALWDIFKPVRYENDEEAYESLLADKALREEFYSRLYEFGKSLSQALSSDTFLNLCDDRILQRYKRDFRKFSHLKNSVKKRYAEAIDYRDYEPKIKKLLDTHIMANEVIQLNKPVNIHDQESMKLVKEEQGIYKKEQSIASKADTIAYETKHITISKMEDDPAFYEKFSKLIQQAIDDFLAKRLSDMDYLKKVMDYKTKVLGKVHDDVPEKIRSNEDAMAYFGVLKEFFSLEDEEPFESIAVDAALAIQQILTRHKKVHFWDDEDAQKQCINEIDDYLFDEVKNRHNIALTIKQIDQIIEKIMKIARHRTK